MNNVDEILKRIEGEIKSNKDAVYDAQGLVKLQEIAKAYNGVYKLIWSDDLLKEIESRPKVELHETGMPLLDGIIGGFREQQLITISAHSKHGKTSWGLFLIEQFAKLNPVMIPLEQSNEELVQQRRDNNYSIPRFLSPQKLAARVTVDWIEERVVEGIAKYNSRLCVIDHLGYIDDYGEDGKFSRENHAYRIEMVMKSLKNLAKKWNVIIMLLVHISQSDEGKPPSLQDLKGSSSILQESDMVMMLWRKNELKKKVRVYENKVMVSILANRRTGKNGNVGMRFDSVKGTFVEEHSWVSSMIKSAEASIEADEIFDNM